MQPFIYKNGAVTSLGYFHASHVQGVRGIDQAIIDFNGSSDYVEAFINQNSGSTVQAKGRSDWANYFMAFRLIGV